MTRRLTYGQLFKKLKALGYRQENVEVNGARERIFRHPEHPRATIFLPETPRDEVVVPMHLGAVRLVLTTHNIAPLDTDQLFFQALGSPEEGA